MWWLTVGCDRPKNASTSQPQTPSSRLQQLATGSSRNATIFIRVGSASTLRRASTFMTSIVLDALVAVHGRRHGPRPRRAHLARPWSATFGTSDCRPFREAEPPGKEHHG